MSIPEQTLIDIKAGVDIVDVINERVKLTNMNNYSPWLIGNCPFHEEKDASLKVNRKTQSWYCYGCGAGSKKDGGSGSDVFAFIQKIDNLTFPEAVTLLGKRIGIEVSNEPIDPAIEILKDMSTEHNRRYFTELWSGSTTAQAALKYLHDRGLTDDTIRLRRLGLVPANEMMNRRDIASIDNRIAIAIVESKSTKDPKGPKTLGMAYRDPSLTPANPKYKNDSSSACFQKGKLLYGLELAQNEIKKQNHGFIVECYFGTMALYQHGIKNVVSTMGTSITEDQVRLMRRYAKNWTLIFDPDAAGVKAVFKSMDLFNKYDINLMFAMLPVGEDPDVCVNRLGGDLFTGYIKLFSKSVMKYFVEEQLAKYEEELIKIKSGTMEKLHNVMKHLGSTETFEDKAYLELIEKRLR